MTDKLIAKLETMTNEQRAVLAHVVTLIDAGQLSPVQVVRAARMLQEGKLKAAEVPNYLRELETLPVEAAS